jgi:LPS-assembly protein
MVGSRATMSLGADQGSVWEPFYRLTGPSNARGQASRADMLSETQTYYEDITYTTCPPGRGDWSIAAQKLTVDEVEGRAVARNARLRIGGVPVFWTPYLSFPIDDRRKSGVLVPTLGSSEQTGIDITVPYYFNIAPNLDATLFPRYMSKRGFALGAELRWLTARQRGEAYGEVLPDDSEYQDGETRGAFRLEHFGNYTPRLSSYVTFNYVSDDQYLEDFGNRLEVTSVRNLERRADLSYSGSGWNLLTRLQDFQTVDASLPPGARPYARLPQALLTVNPRPVWQGLRAGADADYSFFQHDDRVYGHRFAMQPYLTWPLRRPYGYLAPTINLYHTSYALDDRGTGLDESPSHTIPSVNLDSKLIFERTTEWFGRTSLQTLEPRAFYLYTPYEDQDDNPLFDTAALTFSFSSLFRPNRFTGRDRVGDANRLTLGLSSRTLDSETGLELFRASVGQILYFEDRRVQLSPGFPADETSTSAVVGELGARLYKHWSGRASFQWDPDQDEEPLQKRVVELHYETPENHLINLAYRFDQGTTPLTRYEDTDLSVRWPVNPGLELVGRWFYSMEHGETLEAFAGLEYGRCCWRVRLLGRHFKNAPGDSGTNSVMVQVEFAGLGALGHQVDKFLERGIYGYQLQ